MPKPARRTHARGDTTADRRARRPDRIDPCQLYGIDEICCTLDISRPIFYRLVAAGRLKLIDPPIDSRPRVTGLEIQRFLGQSGDENRAEAATATPLPVSLPVGACGPPAAENLRTRGRARCP